MKVRPKGMVRSLWAFLDLARFSLSIVRFIASKVFRFIFNVRKILEDHPVAARRFSIPEVPRTFADK